MPVAPHHVLHKGALVVYAVDSATVVVDATPTLGLALVAEQSVVPPGSQLTYVLTVSNPGTAAVGELALVMPVPAGTSFLSASDAGGAADEVVSWSLAGLNRGEVMQRRMTPRGWQPARIPLWDCLPSGCAHHATGAVGRLESEGVIRMRGTAVQPHLKEFDTLT